MFTLTDVLHGRWVTHKDQPKHLCLRDAATGEPITVAGKVYLPKMQKRKRRQCSSCGLIDDVGWVHDFGPRGVRLVQLDPYLDRLEFLIVQRWSKKTTYTIVRTRWRGGPDKNSGVWGRPWSCAGVRLRSWYCSDECANYKGG